MCNHYEKNQEVIKWASAYAGIENPPPLPDFQEHSWPKRNAPIIVKSLEGGIAWANYRWGVWPYYARDKPQYITNARDDGLLIKPAWKNSTAKRRCLIPASGYYEPGLGPPGARGEVRFNVKGERPGFFLAGLWDRDPDGSGNHAFAMCTTSPNEYAVKFHDRMPLVLNDEDALTWLGFESLAPEVFTRIVRPFRDDMMNHVEIAAAPKSEKKITKTELKQESGELELGF